MVYNKSIQLRSTKRKKTTDVAPVVVKHRAKPVIEDEKGICGIFGCGSIYPSGKPNGSTRTFRVAGVPTKPILVANLDNGIEREITNMPTKICNRCWQNNGHNFWLEGENLIAKTHKGKPAKTHNSPRVVHDKKKQKMDQKAKIVPNEVPASASVLASNLSLLQKLVSSQAMLHQYPIMSSDGSNTKSVVDDSEFANELPLFIDFNDETSLIGNSSFDGEFGSNFESSPPYFPVLNSRHRNEWMVPSFEYSSEQPELWTNYLTENHETKTVQEVSSMHEDCLLKFIENHRRFENHSVFNECKTIKVDLEALSILKEQFGHIFKNLHNSIENACLATLQRKELLKRNNFEMQPRTVLHMSLLHLFSTSMETVLCNEAESAVQTLI